MLSLVAFSPSGKRDYYLANISGLRTTRVAADFGAALAGAVAMSRPLIAVKMTYQYYAVVHDCMRSAGPLPWATPARIFNAQLSFDRTDAAFCKSTLRVLGRNVGNLGQNDRISS